MTDLSKISLVSDTISSPKKRSALPMGIAIIGMGCRFPGGANTPAEFWRVLHEGVDTITGIPPSRWDASRESFTPIPHHGGFLHGVDQFDAPFFRISPREAEALDPQQRLLLEASWEALEDAGINPQSLRGSETGVFVGIFSNDYQRLQHQQTAQDEQHLYLNTGTSAATASGRISYFLGLQGPAMSVDTASSSSLVAFHLACQSLSNGECELALTSGVNLILSPDMSLAFAKAGMLSPDGRSKGFDASANGYVRGEGCGVVVLKRLSDAIRDDDHVLAVVRGSAINQDGASSGLTVPNGSSQEAVIRKALSSAGLEAQDVTYIEAHGSGTPVGDPIEGQALQAVYGEGRTTPWVIGSVKTNIGHLEAAAGIAGIIKATLALHHAHIPPHLHFSKLHPKLAGLQAIIPTDGMRWPVNGDAPRRAGVSSFGFSGTNAHVILEEAASPPPSPPNPSGGEKEEKALSARPYQLLTLSGKDEEALFELAERYDAYLSAHPDVKLADLCYTNNMGRAHFEHRLAAVAESTAELREQLSAFVAGDTPVGLVSGSSTSSMSSRPRIAFLFTGGGAQYVGMGRDLYETEPLFRQTVTYCDQILRPYLEKPLLEVLYPSDESTNTEEIHEMGYMQPALFVIEYALAKLWQSWGIQPDIVMGHSAGEYVAACLAGVFSLEDGLKLITKRGQLMQSTAEGQMVALKASEDALLDVVRPFADDVSIGVINGPESIVISGKRKGIEAVLQRIPHIKATKLKITCASHSPLMQPVLAEFEQATKEVTFHPPQIPVVSNVMGEIADERIITSAYWCRHLRETVRFADGMETLHQQEVDVFVEVGPKPTLLGIARNSYQGQDGVSDRQEKLWLPSLRANYSDWLSLQQSLAELYVRSVPIDWSSFAPATHEGRKRLNLPTYPFQRQRYWGVSAPQAYRKSQQNGHHTSNHYLESQERGHSSPQKANRTSTRVRVSLLEQLTQSNNGTRREVVADYVQKQVRQVLGLRKNVAFDRPLRELGIDSLMGTDLSQRFSKDLQVMIPGGRLLSGSSNINSLTDILLDKIALAPPQHIIIEDGSEEADASPAEVRESDGPTADEADFNDVAAQVPQIHATVTEQVGRKLRIPSAEGTSGDGEQRWVYDFASCNYLGLDLHPEVMDAILPAIKKWGVHPSWTRAVASPDIYNELERELADLVGAPSVLVFPAITLLHAGVLPVLTGYDGVIFKDIAAHRSVHEGCLLAQANGATFIDFKHNDVADLEEKLAQYPYEKTKIIAIDGVYSMSGAYPPLPEFARLAKKYNAWVYMDDAHGIGIIGENPTPEMPYGSKGNGIVRHFDLDYARDRLIYVSGLSKSYSSFGAFITCIDEEMKNRFKTASTFIFSGPSPVASLASAIAGLKLNRREGDEWRKQVYKLTYKLVTEAKAMGFEVINDNFFPIVGVIIGKTNDVVEACKILWEYGILITPALFPIVPIDKGRLRFSITAANTEEEIDRALEALQAVLQMQQRENTS